MSYDQTYPIGTLPGATQTQVRSGADPNVVEVLVAVNEATLEECLAQTRALIARIAVGDIDQLAAALSSLAQAGVNRDITQLLGPDGAGIEWRAGGAEIASATTTDIGALLKLKATITGGETITGFGKVPHCVRFLRFAGAATLTHNATSLILPANGTNILTEPGDTAVATSDGSGNWTVRHYQRANGLPLSGTFRRRTHVPLATGDYIKAEDCGRAFTWALTTGSIGLPTGSTLFPGWWCQVRCTGVPIGYGLSTIVTFGYANTFLLNGRSQSTDTGGTANKGFVVIGGGEEYRFTWTGAEYLIEVVQSPAPGHFTYKRAGSGGYVTTPTAFTLVTASSTDGTNNQAASPYGLGMYAPCDGLYRLTTQGRFFIDQDNTYGSGAFTLSGAVADAYDYYGGLHLKSYVPYEYEDAPLCCTKRLRFGEVVAAYKFASNTNVKSQGASEYFTAELLSRG